MNEPLDQIEGLPTSLQDIAETLGMRVALKLIEHFGGTEISFPKKPADDNPILIALGKEDGLALCQFMSGSFIYIPHGRKRGTIKADVLALHSQGKRDAEIARTLHVSQRWVRQILNSPNNSNQLDLF
jgi:Mor family transcriptional regulator